MNSCKLIGGVTQACETLRVDPAELFEMAARGELYLDRQEPGDPWLVFEVMS